MISIAASAPFPAWIMSYHLRPVGSASISGLPASRSREEAHVVGVIGHDQKVERPRQLRRLAGGRRDLFAPGEAIGVARRHRAPKAPASKENDVCRCVSPKSGRVGKVAAGVGRIGRLRQRPARAVSLVEGADILRCLRRASARQTATAASDQPLAMAFSS